MLLHFFFPCVSWLGVVVVLSRLFHFAFIFHVPVNVFLFLGFHLHLPRLTCLSTWVLILFLVSSFTCLSYSRLFPPLLCYCVYLSFHFTALVILSSSVTLDFISSFLPSLAPRVSSKCASTDFSPSHVPWIFSPRLSPVQPK